MSAFHFLLFRTMHFIEKYYPTLLNTCSKYTNNILDTIVFSKENIYNIIKSLDPNNAHSHDMISIRILKLRDISMRKLLDIII